MSGHGSGWGVITAFVTLGCCLLSAPTANADFDDLLDTVLGSAVAGADQFDLGGVPIDSADLGDLGVLNDPLAQLDQVLHGGQFGLGEPEAGPVDTTHDPDTTPDTTPDAGSGSGASGSDSEHGTSGSDSEHGTSGGSSGNSSSLPKFSMPSGGNGGGGNGGGGSGGSGGSGNSATKSKANAGATKDIAAPPATPQPEVP